MGYEADTPPTTVQENHQSGRQYVDQVRKFVAKELSLGALVGPFSSPPFKPWTRVSPILTRPKKDSADRRIIIDLSYPIGSAVNNGIDTTSILGKDYTYALPSISDLTSKLIQLGGGAWMWKADLSRAYRQLRVDPLDFPLLGLQVDEQYYLDLCPSFRCRSSSTACQRTSNALSYTMGKAGCAILAYLDDYASCAPSKDIAMQQYDLFTTTAQELALKLAKEKCHPPTTSMEWLGFYVNSISMNISIPAKKLQEVLDECSRWIHPPRTNKKRLQSLVGKLVYLGIGIQHTRKFTGRLLSTLQCMSDSAWTTIAEEARLDIKWFLQYASSGNGISLFTPDSDYMYIKCDASLSGAGGGDSDQHYYRWKFNREHIQRYLNIHMLEAINLLVSYKTLAPVTDPRRLTVILLTDNMASSYALYKGKTKDTVLGAWEVTYRGLIFIPPVILLLLL